MIHLQQVLHFTRNPATGENLFYGEWLVNAQGEDVVAGIRTPSPLNDDTKNEQNKHLHSMQEAMPGTYKELCDIRNILEKSFHDMLDIEFTIQEGVLYMLQCRAGKRTGTAALNMAMDMLHEKLIDEKTAVMRVDPAQLDELLHPICDPNAEKKVQACCKRSYLPDLVLQLEKLFSLLKMQLHGSVKVKKLFFSVKKPILRMLKECVLQKVFLLHAVV